MNRKAIQQTLTSALSDWAKAERIPLVVPNLDYEPIVGQAYVRQWFIDAASTDTVLAEGFENHKGIMQVDFNVPYGQGEGLLLQLYDKFKLIFKTKGKIRTKYGMVQLHKVYMSGYKAETPWYTKYVTVEYSAFSDNE